MCLMPHRCVMLSSRRRLGEACLCKCLENRLRRSSQILGERGLVHSSGCTTHCTNADHEVVLVHSACGDGGKFADPYPTVFTALLLQARQATIVLKDAATTCKGAHIPLWTQKRMSTRIKEAASTEDMYGCKDHSSCYLWHAPPLTDTPGCAPCEAQIHVVLHVPCKQKFQGSGVLLLEGRPVMPPR